MSDFILLPGPMVGVETLEPTAVALGAMGHGAQIPDVLATGESVPAWSEWPELAASLIRGDGPFVLVGYSAATSIAAKLAPRDFVSGVVFLDGFIPPPHGTLAPSEGGLLELIRSLPSERGVLPPWHEWWGTEANQATVGLTALGGLPELRERIVAGIPQLTINWFDDVIDLGAWRDKPAGYVRLSTYFDFSADSAERMGWPVRRVDGTHLHPALAPEETARAIVSVVEAFAAG